MTVEEQAAMYIRGTLNREPIESADWFGTDFLPGYSDSDVAWIAEIFERAEQARRLRAQRPLIHNGRKPR